MNIINPILDTSVLVQIFDENSAEHSEAHKIAEYFIDKNISCEAPYISLFELASVIKRKKENKDPGDSFTPSEKITEINPLPINFIPIDESFLRKYFNPNIPYFKTLDSLYIYMALKDNKPLITVDKKMKEHAENLGIKVFTIKEFLSQVVHR